MDMLDSPTQIEDGASILSKLGSCPEQLLPSAYLFGSKHVL